MARKCLAIMMSIFCIGVFLVTMYDILYRPNLKEEYKCTTNIKNKTTKCQKYLSVCYNDYCTPCYEVQNPEYAKLCGHKITVIE